MSEMTLNDVVRRRSDVIEAPSNDALLFMNLEVGNYFMIEATGRAIWERIDGKRSLGEIVDALLDEYEIDRATCEHEVRAFVTELLDQKLVERAG